MFAGRLRFCALGLLLALAPAAMAAEADDRVVVYTETGEVVHRTLTPNGRVTDELPYAQDEILVRFKNTAGPSRKAALHGRLGAKTAKTFRHVRDLELLKLPRGLSVEQAIRTYRGHPDVLYAEPNYRVEHLGVPNDPSFPLQWNLQNTGQHGGTPGADIGAVAAWNITTGSNNVVVAVIDTGVDYNHQDLAANMWRNQADCNNNGIDDDGNGYIDDCYGIDTFNGDSDPMDDHDHGTHVAGIIGAVGDNNIGVVGVNWNVKIMACKFIGAQGFGFVSDAIACLDYVRDMKNRGVNIVATNNSWGSIGFSQALYDAIDAQLDRGILLIAAAGNASFDNDVMPMYPASYYLPNVISVAATNVVDNLSGFSNIGGASVHLGAPGEDILSTTPGNTYSTFSGTSMATPHVTGIAALLSAQVPGRDWKAIKNLILSGGDPNIAPWTVTGKRASALGSLSCSNATVLARVWPRSHYTYAGIRQPVDLAALHINCASPNGSVNVIVEHVIPGSSNEFVANVVLADDGTGADQIAGDGIYSGRWTPPFDGLFFVTFPDGDVITVNIDQDLKPGFPVKAFHGGGTFFGGPVIHTLVGNIDDDPELEIVATGLAAGPLYAWKSNGNLVAGWPNSHLYGAAYPALGQLSTDIPGLEVVSTYWDFLRLAGYSGAGSALLGWPAGFANTTPPALADVDGDGLDEVFVDGTFAYKSDGSALPGWPRFGGGRHTPAIADIDGDGWPEIVSATDMSCSGTCESYLTAHHADGTPVAGFPILLPDWIGWPVIGDVDGDSRPEIVIVNGLSILIFSSNGVLKRQILFDTGFVRAPAMADLDGDGVPEIIVQTDEALSVIHGNGSNHTGWPVVWGNYWAGNSAPVVGDVDGDGLPDIVVVLQLPGRVDIGEVRVYDRNGILHPRFPKTIAIGAGAVPAIADIDGDGRNEIIVTGDYWNGTPGDYDKVWVFDLGGPPHGPIEWGQFRGGPRHQGHYPGEFVPPGHRALLKLEVKKTGAGSGTIDGRGIDCGNDCVHFLYQGDSVVLSAMPDINSVFVGWSGGGCSGNGSCTLVMAADTTVTAQFALNQFTVTASKAGTGTGAVLSHPGINCGVDCSENYFPGTTVTLQAVPDPTSTFAGWSGGGCSGVGDCLLTVDRDIVVTATFLTVPPTSSLLVTSPSQGDVWRLGTKHNIRWQSQGVNGKVRVDISRDGVSWKTIMNGTVNDGVQAWQVTKPKTGGAQIRVCSITSPAVCDASDPFTIK